MPTDDTRHAVSPEMAVALAVADNRLEGIDTPPELETMMLRVARGEISADEAIRERLSALLPAHDMSRPEAFIDSLRGDVVIRNIAPGGALPLTSALAIRSWFDARRTRSHT